MKDKINWTAFSNKSRINIIEKVKESISRNDGYILHFNMFSDLVLSLIIEMEENKISNLHKDLLQVIIISEELPEKLNTISNKEWWIFMNISFSKGKGKLKFEIPAVPG